MLSHVLSSFAIILWSDFCALLKFSLLSLDRLMLFIYYLLPPPVVPNVLLLIPSHMLPFWNYWCINPSFFFFFLFMFSMLTAKEWWHTIGQCCAIANLNCYIKSSAVLFADHLMVMWQRRFFCITGVFFSLLFGKKHALVTTWGSENLLLSYSGIHRKESPDIAVLTRCGWLYGPFFESKEDFLKLSCPDFLVGLIKWMTNPHFS